MAIEVERLRPQAQVRFQGRPEVVTLVAVTPGPFWEFFYRRSVRPGKHVLAESELDGIELVDEPDELRFDGDPLQFRLGVEAQRIDVAFAYEDGGGRGVEHPAAAAPARGCVRLLPPRAAAAVPAGRRSRRGQDDHGRPVHEGADPSPGRRPDPWW